MKLLMRFIIAIIFLPFTEVNASNFLSKSGRNLNTVLRLKPKGLLVRGGHVHTTSSSKQISSRRIGQKKKKIDSSIQSTDTNLPTVKAVLIPRVLAIPQIIRMVSAFLFSSSFLESLRTCGRPFQSAVVSTLQSHGITLLLAGGKVVSEDFSKITPLEFGFNKVLLKKPNFIQLKDSLGLYLMQINEVLERGSQAPIEYVLPTLKQIVVNNRKLKLIKQLKSDIVNDAIKNKKFEIYN